MSDFNEQGHRGVPRQRGPGGRQLRGRAMLLLHHRGRRSGRDSVAPDDVPAADDDPATIYVFASKAGAPTNPDWYHNLLAAGTARSRSAPSSTR